MSFYELVHFQALALQLRGMKQEHGITKDADIYYKLESVIEEIEEMISEQMKKKRT